MTRNMLFILFSVVYPISNSLGAEVEKANEGKRPYELGVSVGKDAFQIKYSRGGFLISNPLGRSIFILKHNKNVYSTESIYKRIKNNKFEKRLFIRESPITLAGLQANLNYKLVLGERYIVYAMSPEYNNERTNSIEFCLAVKNNVSYEYIEEKPNAPLTLKVSIETDKYDPDIIISIKNNSSKKYVWHGANPLCMLRLTINGSPTFYCKSFKLSSSLATLNSEKKEVTFVIKPRGEKNYKYKLKDIIDLCCKKKNPLLGTTSTYSIDVSFDKKTITSNDFRALKSKVYFRLFIKTLMPAMKKP